MPSDRSYVRSRLVPALLVLINLGALSLVGFVFIHRMPPSAVGDPLPYHYRLNLAVLRPAIRPNARYILIAFVNRSTEPHQLSYLRVLENRYAESGLQVIRVPSSSSKPASPGISSYNDSDGGLHRLCRVSQEGSGVVVADTAGTVEFFGRPLPQVDDLRQVTEQALLGRIGNAPGKDEIRNSFVTGQAIPPLQVRRVSGGGLVTLDTVVPNNGRVLVLSAPCAPCQLNTLLQRQSSMPEPTRRATVVLMAPQFETEATVSALTSLFPRESLLIFADRYDPYSTRTGDPDQRPWIVSMDRSHRISDVRRIETF